VNESDCSDSADPQSAVPEPAQPAAPRVPSGASTVKTKAVTYAGINATFEEIYRGGTAKLPETPYSILKVAEMIDSQHLSGMSPEAKRCALLMAFEAAGIEVEVLLKDAMLRQRALNDFEEEQRARLKEFETAKASENSAIQAESDRIVAEHLRRIQANTDEVARRQDEFEAWQRRKQRESQRIADAAALCIHQTGGTAVSKLTAVLERSAVSGR
jgi:hypothetical protein